MSTTPRRLGQYELLHYLGRGSVGEVWKARDLALHRDVAVKIFHSDLQRSEQHFLTRLTNDGQALVALRHSNVVPIHEVKVSRPLQAQETTAFLVMDYIEGLTLTDYIRVTSRAHAFPALTDLIYLFTSLGVAIDHAHQQGIIHGNIKPTNILLNKQDTTQFKAGEPLLTDFGLTQLAGLSADSGSPFYISPEQAQGYPANNRSDVYALGVLLYELCTGVVPFRDESSVAVMMQHIKTLPTPPALINANIPPALSEVILRAMAKDPVARFPMASLLAAAIADACSLQSTLYIGEQLSSSGSQGTSDFNSATSILGVMQPPSAGRYPPLPQPKTTLPLSAPHPNRPSQISLSGQFKGLPTRQLSLLPATNPSAQTSPVINNQPENVPSAETPLSTTTGDQSARTIASLPSRPLKVTKAAPTSNLPTQTTSRQISLPSTHDRTVSTPPPPPQQVSPMVSSPPPAPTPYTQNQPSYPTHPYEQPFSQDRQYAQPVQSAQPVTSQPSLRQLYNRAPNYVLIASVLIVILVLGSAITASVLLNKSPETGSTVPGRIFLQDDPEGLGRNSHLRVDLYRLENPPADKQYFVWMQKTDQSMFPLGALPAPNEGKASLTYPGDDKNTNLVGVLQGILVTVEDAGTTPAQPATQKLYEAAFSNEKLQALKNVLYATPGLPDNTSAIAALLDTVSSIQEKSTSIADSYKQDNGLVVRQATRVIDMIDGTAYAQQSGDRPAHIPPQLQVERGLISSPDVPGYLDLLEQQIQEFKRVAGDDPAALQHAQGVENAITNLRGWIETLRKHSSQLLKATDLTAPEFESIVRQIKQIASDAYTGRVIPPDTSPQPTVGSAGAVQAYSEAQYLASLELRQL